MTNTRHSSYRGCAITTRWTESDPPFPTPRRFTASFSIDPGLSAAEASQEFLTAAFTTSIAASANARIAAMESIDRELGLEDVIPMRH